MSNDNTENRNAAERKTIFHWADRTADQIIRERGDLDLYTCASGITPSGTVHIGNFREIISVDLVVRALRDRGKKVRFIYSWDDYDVFRKVPLNMPNQDILEKHLRYPITLVPDTTGRDSSYARHHDGRREDGRRQARARGAGRPTVRRGPLGDGRRNRI